MTVNVSTEPMVVGTCSICSRPIVVVHCISDGRMSSEMVHYLGNNQVERVCKGAQLVKLPQRPDPYANIKEPSNPYADLTPTYKMLAERMDQYMRVMRGALITDISKGLTEVVRQWMKDTYDI